MMCFMCVSVCGLWCYVCDVFDVFCEWCSVCDLLDVFVCVCCVVYCV